MDNVKEFLGLFRRQHFWFVAPVLLVLAIVGWVMASKKVQKEVESNKTKITGFFSKADSVANVGRGGHGHPNSEWHDGMRKLIANRRANVEQAWTLKWNRQKDVLKWPAELSFASRANEMRPIESVEKTANFSTFERTEYKRFIQKQLPLLAEIVGSVWAPSGVGEGRRRSVSPNSFERDGQEQAAEPALVEWSPASQGEIAGIFDWGDGLPSTIEALYAQEDIWVLKALMEIIRTTNDGATTRSTAAIKEIEAVKLGKLVDALAAQGWIIQKPGPLPSDSEDLDPQDAIQQMAGGGGTDDGTAAEMARASGGLMPEGMEGVPLQKPHPGKGRYHDENFAKIDSVEVLKSSLDVAKRIPVRLRVKIDQRQIHRFFAACANSPLTFEVRQFRFNPSGEAVFGGGSESFSRAEGGMGQQQARQLENVDSFDHSLEVYGFVYIFNPVNSGLLNGEEPEIAPESEI